MCDSDKPAMPCFLCRQVFIEFFNSNVEIYIYNKSGNKEKYTLEQICPLPFSKGDLN